LGLIIKIEKDKFSGTSGRPVEEEIGLGVYFIYLTLSVVTHIVVFKLKFKLRTFFAEIDITITWPSPK